MLRFVAFVYRAFFVPRFVFVLNVAVDTEAVRCQPTEVVARLDSSLPGLNTRISCSAIAIPSFGKHGDTRSRE